MNYVRLAKLMALTALAFTLPALHGMNNASTSTAAGTGAKAVVQKPGLLYSPANVYSKQRRAAVKNAVSQHELAVLTKDLNKLVAYYLVPSIEPLVCGVGSDAEFDCVALSIKALLDGIADRKKTIEWVLSPDYVPYRLIGPELPREQELRELREAAMMERDKRELAWLEAEATVSRFDDINKRLTFAEQGYKREIPVFLKRLIDESLPDILAQKSVVVIPEETLRMRQIDRLPEDTARSKERMELAMRQREIRALANLKPSDIASKAELEETLAKLTKMRGVVFAELIARAKDRKWFKIAQRQVNGKTVGAIVLREDDDQKVIFLRWVARELAPLIRVSQELEAERQEIIQREVRENEYFAAMMERVRINGEQAMAHESHNQYAQALSRGRTGRWETINNAWRYPESLVRAALNDEAEDMRVNRESYLAEQNIRQEQLQVAAAQNQAVVRSDDRGSGPVTIAFEPENSVCQICATTDLTKAADLAVCSQAPTLHFLCTSCFSELGKAGRTATNERQCPFCRIPGMQVRPLVVGRAEAGTVVATSTSSSVSASAPAGDEDVDEGEDL